MNHLDLPEGYDLTRTPAGLVQSFAGELEFIVRDGRGHELQRRRERDR